MAKVITAKEINAHNTKANAWFCIEDKVYDVTNFIDQHPGGEEVILEQVGSDATEAFVDVGHSDDARKILSGLYIGDLAPGEVVEKPVLPTFDTAPVEKSESSTLSNLVLPILFAVLFTIYKTYF